MIEIRNALAEDVPRLAELVSQYWAFEGISQFETQRVSELLLELIRRPDAGSLWIAHVDGAPAGYLLAVYVFSLEYGGVTAEIDELFVLAAYRAQGVGASLLKAAETEFARRGCRKVALQLSRHNEGARAFYHRSGYTERAGYELLDKTPWSRE
jgi:GNAT superfamily N-acetyltransferase